MGTSAPYVPTPQWSSIKTDLTQSLNAGPVEPQAAHDLIRSFVQQLGVTQEEGFGDLPTEFGHLTPEEAQQKIEELTSQLPPAKSEPRFQTTSSRQSSSTPGAGDGNSRSGGQSRRTSRGGGGGGAHPTGSRAVRPVAQRLADFITQVTKVGLRTALSQAGYETIDELPPEQIALAIVDVLATDATLLIETELRAALATVIEKLCVIPESLAAAEQQICDSSTRLESVVETFFECYIMERFKTFFCEHEASKHGYEAADNLLKEAREYVASEIALEKADRRDLTAVNWNSKEGAAIIDAILERTIAVYTT